MAKVWQSMAKVWQSMAKVWQIPTIEDIGEGK
jgi:hypothetical protein